MSKPADGSNPQGLSSDGVVSSANGRSSDGPDTIARAIKEEILKKQFEIMRSWYAAQAESEAEKEKIAKYNEAQLRVHSNNPDLAAKAEKDTELHAKLNQAEVQGYKNVNTKFQGQFSNLEWDNSSTPDSRVKEIKNANGEVIANLVEKTVKGPVNFPTINGGVAKVENYRAVDFPLELKGEGPMHLQMAVKDVQGNNIAADKAVYFTAHYDKQGKLEDFSHPQPIKFAGEGKDAIGYIEREGQIYTLPITRGKLDDMQAQLDTNRSLDVNRAAGRASDTVDAGSPDRPRTQAPTVGAQNTTPVQPTVGIQTPQVSTQTTTPVQPTVGTQTPQASTQTTTPVQPKPTSKPLPDPKVYRTQRAIDAAAKKTEEATTQNPQGQDSVQPKPTSKPPSTFVKGILTPEQRQSYSDQDKLKSNVKTTPTVDGQASVSQNNVHSTTKPTPKLESDLQKKGTEPVVVQKVDPLKLETIQSKENISVDPTTKAQANKLRSGLTRANSVPDLAKVRKQDSQEVSKDVEKRKPQ